MAVDPFPGVLPSRRHSPCLHGPYQYALNNPLRYTDPSGEFPLLLAVGLGALIGGAVGGIGYALQHPGQSLGEYARNAEFRRAVGIGAASGAVAGLVGWAVPSLLPAASSFWGAVGLGALTGAATSFTGQVVTNLLTPCTPWQHNLGWAILTGALGGAIAGGVGYGIRQWAINRMARARAVPLCFVAGTQIATPDESVAIEDLQVGDTVLALDAADNVVVGKVTDTFTNTATTLIDLTLRDTSDTVYTITGTPEHPFYVPVIGNYVPMRELDAGTTLRAADGTTVIVLNRSIRHGTFTVYNFTVAEWHTYFVASAQGGAAVAVHNTCSVSAEEIIASGHTDILDSRTGWPLRGPQSACQVCATNAGISPEFFGQKRALLEFPGIPHVVLGIVDDAGNVIIIDNTRGLGGILGNRVSLDQYIQNVVISGLAGTNPVVQIWGDFLKVLRYIFY